MGKEAKKSEIRRMREMWASFREEETASCSVLASLYLKPECCCCNRIPPASAQCPRFQVRGLWKSHFLCNPSTDIAGWEQYCQRGRKQQECVWHDWVPSWAQLFKRAFPLEVGPKSHWGRALPLFLPECQWVEQSWLSER